jgi:hypothetical protein
MGPCRFLFLYATHGLFEMCVPAAEKSAVKSSLRGSRSYLNDFSGRKVDAEAVMSCFQAEPMQPWVYYAWAITRVKATTTATPFTVLATAEDDAKAETLLSIESTSQPRSIK